MDLEWVTKKMSWNILPLASSILFALSLYTRVRGICREIRRRNQSRYNLFTNQACTRQCLQWTRTSPGIGNTPTKDTITSLYGVTS